MASDIYGKDHSDSERGNSLPHMGYSFRLAGRVLLYAPSPREDSTYHDLCTPVASTGWNEKQLNGFTMKDRSDERSYNGATSRLFVYFIVCLFVCLFIYWLAYVFIMYLLFNDAFNTFLISLKVDDVATVTDWMGSLPPKQCQVWKRKKMAFDEIRFVLVTLKLFDRSQVSTRTASV